MKLLYATILCSLLIRGYAHSHFRNFIFIADGMSKNHLKRISEDINKGLQYSDYVVEPYIPYGQKTPESASSATALFTMCERDAGQVGFSGGLDSVIRNQGKNIGIISTSCILDATVASFISESNNRYEYSDVSKNINTNNLKLFLGGSTRLFDWGDRVGNHCKAFNKKELYEARECEFTTLIGEFSNKNTLYGEMGCSFMQYASNRTHDVPSLKDMVREGIRHMESVSPKGYTLVVSSDIIDHALHKKDSFCIEKEINEFKEAMDYTLNDFLVPELKGSWKLMMTSDHETSIIYGEHTNSNVGAYIFSSDYENMDPESQENTNNPVHIRQQELISHFESQVSSKNCPKNISKEYSELNYRYIIATLCVTIAISLCILIVMCQKRKTPPVLKVI